MMELLLLSTPIIVSVITQGFKSLRKVAFSAHRKEILRFVAATLSFFGVMLASVVTTGELPMLEIQTYAESVAVFLATQIPYYFGKKN